MASITFFEKAEQKSSASVKSKTRAIEQQVQSKKGGNHVQRMAHVHHAGCSPVSARGMPFHKSLNPRSNSPKELEPADRNYSHRTDVLGFAGDEMLIIDDWLDDWIGERKNIMADDVLSLSSRLQKSALADGYSMDKLLDASGGDLDRFVRRAVVSRLIADSPPAPLMPSSALRPGEISIA